MKLTFSAMFNFDSSPYITPETTALDLGCVLWGGVRKHLQDEPPVGSTGFLSVARVCDTSLHNHGSQPKIFP